MLKTVNVWSVDNVETLKGCFICTDWEVFTPNNPDINTATDSVTDYIKFCTETVIPKKTVKCFTNNKPYITRISKTAYKEKSWCLQGKTDKRSNGCKRNLTPN